jgi:hypothetical protein
MSLGPSTSSRVTSFRSASLDEVDHPTPMMVVTQEVELKVHQQTCWNPTRAVWRKAPAKKEVEGKS